MADSVRERLIACAIELIRTKGVAGTTVSDLLEESGVARRSLYVNFPGGREELLAESARRAGAAMSAALREAVADAPDLGEAVEDLAATVRAGLLASDFDAGCPVAAGALSGRTVPEAREHAGATFASWCEAIAEGLTERGHPAARARSLAFLLVSAIEGAMVLSIAVRSTEPLDEVAVELRQLVGSAL
ncbi:transcriptional regulatory protein [Streptomyces albus]|uniref:Transcriptional regulatory protein n=1 Tax=Streptomyces albus (strain ATCC 21838 / DSM 41398 / FERM P-419 / JCM 4703 / NBRC 107858) TaxID=1081613 RepID=A0A0B5EZT6_STRA4|nr:transcriptional regulatory protein [Streptomyces albus]AOU78441.1 transcriptional regulatory protein [Streptomyces albus]AYN34189.1 transcriptional regulatory protein [Streptomyces albus]